MGGSRRNERPARLPHLGRWPGAGGGVPLGHPAGGARDRRPCRAGAQPAGWSRGGRGSGGAGARRGPARLAAPGPLGGAGDRPHGAGDHTRPGFGRVRHRSVEERTMDDLKAHIREVPDFPKPGINFYDITTLLQHPLALRMTVDRFVWLFAQKRIDKVVGIESRGFMFAPIVAYDLNAGFVPVRKPGKLPYQKIRQTYDLEYGTDSIEMHDDAIQPGEHVLIVDDLVATGGTALAAAKMVESLGGKVAGFGFIIELTFLPGRQKLQGYEVESLIRY